MYDSSPADADYFGALPGFSLLKQVSTSSGGPWSSAINVGVGADVFYKFTLVNTGAIALSSISVTDPLVDASSCTFTDPLPIGGATTCIVGPIISSGAANSTTTNTATGHGSTGIVTIDTAPSSASYTIVVPTADLAITKDDGTASVTAGGSTTYTITVTNNGPDEVSSATVVDTAPAGMSLGNWTCSVTNPGSGGSVTTACGAASGSGDISTTVTMKNSAVITYSVPATIAGTASGSLANTATVTVPAGVTDPTPGNNSATDTDTVAVTADLSITKTDSASSVVPGTSTTYTLVVVNNGPGDITGATVSDIFPAAIASDTFTAVASGGASGFSASGTGNISDTVNLPSGSTITYTVQANVSSSATGSVANTATVTAPVGVTDSNLANNTATDTDTLTPQADLAITKTDGVASVSAGGSTIYGLGAPPGREGWEVGIQDPIDPRRIARKVLLKDRALSVAGIREKSFEAGGVTYAHIMDPRTGRPVSDMLSVAVLAGRGTAGDALDDVFFVQG
ncbi:MAG TPA: FAD:protein FMN transferase, partial [Pseudonocardiaceae bacterium]